MTKLFEVAAMLREALCCHEAFRKLGFVSDQLYLESGLSLSGSGVRHVFVTIKTIPDDFRVWVGTTERTVTELAAEWTAAVEAFNTGSEEELQALWDASIASQNLKVLAVTIAAKGIRIPAIDAALRAGMN